MKKAILVAIIGVFAVSVNAGDWGGGKGVAPKAPKAPIGCPDTSGYVEVGYHTDGIYKGYRFAEDTVSLAAGYTFESVVPITLSVAHFDGHGNGGLMGSNNIAPGVSAYGGFDMTAVGLSAQVASVAGFDVALSYTHRFWESNPVGAIIPQGVSSSGEIGLNITRDLGVAVAHLDVFYNLNNPNAWNITAPGVVDDDGSWYWDLGLDKSIGITDNISLVLSGGVAYADNYWGALPVGQSGGASGWNHYYLRASLPIELNCAATITPYIGYNGAPNGWLMDGAPLGGSSPGEPQSDILHAGISVNVKF